MFYGLHFIALPPLAQILHLLKKKYRMKKIFMALTALALMLGVSEVNAQKKVGGKKSHMSAKARAAAKEKAEKERIEAEKKAEEERIAAEKAEKERLEQERLEQQRIQRQQEEEQIAKDRAERELQAQAKKEEEKLNRQKWSRIDKGRDEVYQKAGIPDNQGRQVKLINQEFHQKASAIRENSGLSDDAKKEELAKLNEQRLDRIKQVVGKKAGKLEATRKELRQGHKDDTDEDWLDEIDGYKKGKKSKA